MILRSRAKPTARRLKAPPLTCIKSCVGSLRGRLSRRGPMEIRLGRVCVCVILRFPVEGPCSPARC